MKTYGISNFIRIANEFINGDTRTVAGIEKRIKAWYCFHYNTTLNDDKLLDMTLEELLVLYQMHRIKDDPTVLAEVGISAKEEDEFEDWLKEQMGDEYVSNDDMVKGMDKEEQEFQTKIREKFPDKVTTNFSQFDKD